MPVLHHSISVLDDYSHYRRSNSTTYTHLCKFQPKFFVIRRITQCLCRSKSDTFLRFSTETEKISICRSNHLTLFRVLAVIAIVDTITAPHTQTHLRFIACLQFICRSSVYSIVCVISWTDQFRISVINSLGKIYSPKLMNPSFKFSPSLSPSDPILLATVVSVASLSIYYTSARSYVLASNALTSIPRCHS